MCFGVLALCLMASPSNFSLPASQLLGKGPTAHRKYASLPPAFPPGAASTSSFRDDSRGPLAGPDATCSILRARCLVGGPGST